MIYATILVIFLLIPVVIAIYFARINRRLEKLLSYLTRAGVEELNSTSELREILLGAGDLEYITKQIQALIDKEINTTLSQVDQLIDKLKVQDSEALHIIGVELLKHELKSLKKGKS